MKNNRLHVFLATIGMAAFAFVLRLVLEGVLQDKATFLPFFAVVIVSSALGGFWPGILATFISIVGASLLLKLPGRPELDTQQLALQMALFTGSGFLIAVVGENFIRAKRRMDGLSARLVAAEASRMLALESGRMGTWEWDRLENRVEWAPTMGSVFGLDPAEFPKTFEQYLALIHPEDREGVQQSLLEAVDQAQPQFDGRYRMLSPEGQIRWIASRGTTHIHDGRVTSINGVCWQVTEEVEVALAQARLASIVETSDDGIISKDLQGTILTWNQGAEKIFGYSPEEAIGKPIQILLPPDRQHEEAHILSQLRQGISIKNMETIRMRKDGRLIDVNLTISPVFDAERRIVGVSKFVRDVTEQKLSEQALEESRSMLAAYQRRLQQLIDSIPVLISFVDIDSRYQLVNKQYEIWFKVSASDVIGKHMKDVIGEKAFQAIQKYVDRALAGEEVTYEMQLPYAQAGTKFVRAHYIPSRNITGEVNGFFVLVADHTEVNIRELNARFLASASSTLAEVGDYRTSLSKIAKLAVPHFAEWCAIDLVTDSGMERLTVPDKDESFRVVDELSLTRNGGNPGIWRVLQSGSSELESDIPELELSARLGERSQFAKTNELHSYICVPLKVAGETLGSISMVVASSRRAYRPEDLEIAEDLARRASVMIENATLYERLQDSDRKKDEFLATLAHELRNPLAPLRTGLDLLAVSSDRPETVSELHTIMERQTNQLIRLVDDLLDISRITTGKLELRKEAVEIEDIIKHAVESNRALLEERGQSLFVQALNEIPTVSADPVRLTQVIQNLLNNAAKYTDPGGTIQLTTQHVESDLVIAVKDNGIGIDPAQLENVFGMFSQVQSALTRAQGGLGIGLALVKGLVEIHGGRIEVHSEGLGQGSEFIVRLPARSDDIPPKRSEGDTTGRRTVKKILVVDDNEDNANLLGKMLELAGNEVETANTGLDAIRKFQDFRPDVMFLDIGMPDMNGYQVAERILQGPHSDQVVLVALTGWGSDEDRKRTREAGFHHHLVKPVQMADLGKLLEAGS